MITIVTVYQGLMTISYMLMEPYGDDVIDLPVDHIITYNARCVEAIFTASSKCPAEDAKRGIVPAALVSL